MENTLLIIVLLLIVVAVIGVWTAFAGRRRMKAKKLIVEKDMRNPSVPPKSYWAIHDKKRDGIMLYSNLFKPFKDKIIPPFNLDAYIHDKIIYCLKGVTGNPEDDNIVPIHYTLVGKTGSAEFSKELSGAIRNTNGFIEMCSKFKEGQKVKYPLTEVSGGVNVMGYQVQPEKKEVRAVSGYIRSIGYQGLELVYQKPATVDGVATVVDESMFLQPSQLKNLHSDMDEADFKKLAETPLQNFYNAEWVMRNLGVIPVDDVNAVLENQKSAVAQFNSKIDERRNQRQTWMTRNAAALVLVTYVAVLAVVTVVLFYAVTQDATQLLAQGSGATTAHAANSLLTNILPKTATGPT